MKNSESVIPQAWKDILNTSEFMPVVVDSISRYFDTGWTKKSSAHTFYEMVYIKKGNGRFIIENKPIFVGPNDIVIIKPNKKHEFTADKGEKCEFIVLHFNFTNKYDKGNHISFNKSFSNVPIDYFVNFVSETDKGAHIKLKVNQKNEIINLLNRLTIEQEYEELDSRFLQYLLIMELFVMLSRALKMEWEQSIRSESPELKELIQLSIEYIHNNYERNISLSDISNYVFLSQSYFARSFKRETSMSPIKYLLKIRIDRAKELLSETNTKAQDIALNVGFSNQQRFNEIFRKYTGMTPIAYRKESIE